MPGQVFGQVNCVRALQYFARMKIKTLTLALIFFALQNAALAEVGSEPVADVEAVLASAMPTEMPVLVPMPVPRPAAADGVALKNLGIARAARVTFYNPNSNSLMEGGPINRFTERINSVEDAIRNGRPVTVAADIYGPFGEMCNQRDKRCLLLIRLPGFDTAYPSYRKKFAKLPRNSFIALVEDTGGAFFNTEGKRFDIAVRSHNLAGAVPPYINPQVKWMRLHSPCGNDARARRCQLSDAHITGEAMSAMGLSGRDL